MGKEMYSKREVARLVEYAFHLGRAYQTIIPEDEELGHTALADASDYNKEIIANFLEFNSYLKEQVCELSKEAMHSKKEYAKFVKIYIYNIEDLIHVLERTVNRSKT